MAEMAKWYKDIKAEIEGSTEYKVQKEAFNIAMKVFTRLKELKMTQKELADRLNVSRSYISQVLSGKPNMTLSTLFKFANSLDFDIKINLTPISVSSIVQAKVVTNKADEKTVYNDFKLFNPFIGSPTSASDESSDYSYPIANA